MIDVLAYISVMRPGFASQEFVKVHVCFLPCWMLPVSTFWLRWSSWVSQLMVQWSSIKCCHRVSYVFNIYIFRKGQALQFNWLYDKGAFILHPDEKFSVDFSKVKVFHTSSLMVLFFFTSAVKFVLLLKGWRCSWKSE